MKRHAARQLPSWLIFDVGQKSLVMDISPHVAEDIEEIRANLAKPVGFYASTSFTSIFENRGSALFWTFDAAKEWLDFLTGGLSSTEVLDEDAQRFWISKIWRRDFGVHDRLVPLSIHLPYYLECTMEEAKIEADEWFREYRDSTPRNGCSVFDLATAKEHYWERNLEFDAKDGFRFRFSFEVFDRNE